MGTPEDRGKRLKTFNVVIQTEYGDKGKLKLRRSDGTLNDDVESGVILDKKYYQGQTLRHQETEFNPGILYSFVFPKFDEGRVICPNCGGVGTADSFSSGCPFCGASYNLEYSAKDLGSRAHADYVSHKKLRLLPIALSIAVCAALAVLVTLLTGRTLRPFDFCKAAVVGVFIGALAGLIWSYVTIKGEITAADAEKKQRQEAMLHTLQAQLGAAGASLSDYTNALVSELETYFFGGRPETADVIDFDVLDYTSHTVRRSPAGELLIETEVLVRPVFVKNGAVRSEEQTLRVLLKKNSAKSEALAPGVNFRACKNCGAALDLRAPRCAYCGAPTTYQKPFLPEGIEAV